MGFRKAKQPTDYALKGLDERPMQDRVSACQILVAILRHTMHSAQLDLFSDLQELPDDVQTSLDALRELAPPVKMPWKRRAEKTFMGVEVDMQNSSHASYALTVAPYLIYVHFLDENRIEGLTMTDTGTDVTFPIDLIPNLDVSSVRLPDGIELIRI